MNIQAVTLLRPFWQKVVNSPFQLGGLLILLWGIPRFIVVLLANKTGQYQWVSLIFVSMWLSPWIFFTKAGRIKMGLSKPKSWPWVFAALIGGGLACLLMFLVAVLLFGDSISNWFVYISNSYSSVPAELSASDRMIFFVVFAGIGMLFSPIGEEFLYRGVIHECFAASMGNTKASFIDSAAFALTHLAHFGIVYELGNWRFLPIPSFIWVFMLFFTCLFFFFMRKKSGSILGAIVAHAAFNVMMSYLIFYHIL